MNNRSRCLGRVPLLLLSGEDPEARVIGWLVTFGQAGIQMNENASYPPSCSYPSLRSG